MSMHITWHITGVDTDLDMHRDDPFRSLDLKLFTASLSCIDCNMYTLNVTKSGSNLFVAESNQARK